MLVRSRPVKCGGGAGEQLGHTHHLTLPPQRGLTSEGVCAYEFEWSRSRGRVVVVVVVMVVDNVVVRVSLASVDGMDISFFLAGI